MDCWLDFSTATAHRIVSYISLHPLVFVAFLTPSRMTVSKPQISEHDSNWFGARLTHAKELYEFWAGTWDNVPKLAQFELGYKKEDIEWIGIDLLKVSLRM